MFVCNFKALANYLTAGQFLYQHGSYAGIPIKIIFDYADAYLGISGVPKGAVHKRSDYLSADSGSIGLIHQAVSFEASYVARIIFGADVDLPRVIGGNGHLIAIGAVNPLIAAFVKLSSAVILIGFNTRQVYRIYRKNGIGCVTAYLGGGQFCRGGAVCFYGKVDMITLVACFILKPYAESIFSVRTQGVEGFCAVYYLLAAICGIVCVYVPAQIISIEFTVVIFQLNSGIGYIPSVGPYVRRKISYCQFRYIIFILLQAYIIAFFLTGNTCSRGNGERYFGILIAVAAQGKGVVYCVPFTAQGLTVLLIGDLSIGRQIIINAANGNAYSAGRLISCGIGNLKNNVLISPAAAYICVLAGSSRNIYKGSYVILFYGNGGDTADVAGTVTYAESYSLCAVRPLGIECKAAVSCAIRAPLALFRESCELCIFKRGGIHCSAQNGILQPFCRACGGLILHIDLLGQVNVPLVKFVYVGNYGSLGGICIYFTVFYYKCNRNACVVCSSSARRCIAVITVVNGEYVIALEIFRGQSEGHHTLIAVIIAGYRYPAYNAVILNFQPKS